MSNNLFADFGVDIGPVSEPALTSESRRATSTPADSLEAIQALDHAFRAVKAHIPPNIRDKLNSVYLNQLTRAMLKRGEFVFLCARCHKPIRDPAKQYFCEELGLVYGTDCWGGISDRQHRLQVHHYTSGQRIPGRADELQAYICTTSGREFLALPENARHCGSTPRTCAACPGTAVRNKHVPCDFERAVGIFPKKGRS